MDKRPTSDSSARDQRRAAALRANLRKRKDQARARAEAEPDAAVVVLTDDRAKPDRT